MISCAVVMWLVNFKLCFVFSALLVFCSAQIRKKVDDKIKCPKVKAIRNFDLEQVKLYYACRYWIFVNTVGKNLLKNIVVVTIYR